MTKSTLLKLFLCILFNQQGLSSGSSKMQNVFYDAKQALVTKLTNNSRIIKEILPVVDNSTPVLVNLSLALHQISTVDEINQAIRLTVWLRLYWNNPYLQWNPADYEGIKSVHLDNSNFWKPDIALVNQAILEEEIDILYKRIETNQIIKCNGDVKWLAPLSLFSQCKIDVSRFPFDKQECKIKFSSWIHAGNDINLTYSEEQVELKEYIQNGEWKVESALLKRNEKIYSSSDIPYPDVTFHLRIKRRPLYYIINLLVPCSLIALLSFLSFILPSNHGERISLVITVLLANSVYMLIVSASLPRTSDAVPAIGVYFVAIICEIALCLLATSFTVKIYEKKSEMPKWFDKLVNIQLASLFCTKKLSLLEKAEEETLDELRHEKFTRITDDKTNNDRQQNGIEAKQHARDIELVDTGFAQVKEDFPGFGEPNQNQLTFAVLPELNILADDVRARNTEIVLGKKWRRAARILDRFFLVVFLFIYIILTAYLLASM